MLLLGSIRSIMIICIRTDNVFFLKSSRPSLPLRKAPPFSPSLSSIVFATLSVPLLGDRNPQEREDVAGSAIAPPGFWSASGACAHKGLAGSAYAIKLRLFDATELRVFVGWRIS